MLEHLLAAWSDLVLPGLVLKVDWLDQSVRVCVIL